MTRKNQRIAKYLVVVVSKGMTSEVNYFTSLKEAKRAFNEIAHDYGYEPEDINASDRYDVSIWEWTEDRYEKNLWRLITALVVPCFRIREILCATEA
jgi:hypothetical protein